MEGRDGRAYGSSRSGGDPIPRTILHLDLDAFFCAVEELRDPALRGLPFAVGGSPEGRGVVSSCSYAARRYGVRSAMPMARALALCPGLSVVPADFRAYKPASARVMALLREAVSLVEQISIDEAFLDATDHPLTGVLLATRLQAAIRDRLGLPCSLGVATNKLVAKVATDVGKAGVSTDGYPNAIRVVPPGTEAAFLAPLPAGALWGVGPKTGERLAALGMRTIGDIAAWPEADLARRFGRHGRELAARARGMDDRPLVPERAAKSLSRETTFARDVSDEATLLRTIRAQAASVGRRLRRAGLAGDTVRLKLRWDDFTTLTRQASLREPASDDALITATAARLLRDAWRPGQPVRLVGVGVSGLEPARRQLTLWDARPAAEDENARRLRAAVAALQDRYGAHAVRWDAGSGSS